MIEILLIAVIQRLYPKQIHCWVDVLKSWFYVLASYIGNLQNSYFRYFISCMERFKDNGW